MDTATAIATARKVAKMADKVIKYIKADNDASYGLDEEVSVVLMGDDVCKLADGQLVTPVETKDGSLSISAVWSNGWLVHLTAHPFPAESRLWNGPDVIANNQYRSMLASLFHDLIWGHADELARAWGVTKWVVLTWGNGVLYALWMYASADSLRGRIEARIAWMACEFSKSWYHAFKKLVGLHCLAFALLLAAGCGTPPDWTVAEITGTNAIHRAMGRVETVAPAAEPPESVQDGEPAVAPVAPIVAPVTPTASADAVDFASLDWSYGGFNGKNAKPADGCEIGSLKVTADGMSYKWVKGGCEQLGASSREDAACIAALFVRRGGKWAGGKWEWISTSRTTRSFTNIAEGYNGWPRDAVATAEAFAFVICSKDGKRRSNVALFSK